MDDSPLLARIVSITDADLARSVGFETLNRGVQYATGGRVTSIDVSNDLVLAQVRGSRAIPYTVLITEAVGQLDLSCSCPLQGDCKHCVAVILRLRAAHARSASYEPRGTEPVPTWRMHLDPFVRRGDGGGPLAIQVGSDHSGITLSLRSQGRTRRWIKSDIDWQRLRYPAHRFDERQRRALMALADTADRSTRSGGYYAYYHDQISVMQLDRATGDVWRWLQAAIDAGVEILPPPGISAVELAPAAEVVVEAVTDIDGAVELLVYADDDGEHVVFDPVHLVGHPPHGMVRQVDDRLRLVPLTRHLDDDTLVLATRRDVVRVPASDVAEFMTEYLPALRQRVSLRETHLQLPEAEPPQLVAELTVIDGPAGESGAVLAWTFLYRVGGRLTEVLVPRTSFDPFFRDADAEVALVESIDPGPWHGPVAHQLRETELRGRDWMRFVEDTLPRWQQRDDIVVHITGDPGEYREAGEAPQVRVGVQPPDAAHWFGLDVDVSIDGEEVPFADLFAALSLGHSELVLPSGLWFDLDRPELQTLRELITEASKLTDREPGELALRPEHVSLWQELVELGVVSEQSQAWRDAAEALLHVEHLPEIAPGDEVRATLRPYQTTGFRWLVFLWRSRLGGILADEMGLGKTLQSLALLAWAKANGELDQPALVVAPTSVLATWAREAETFAPGLRVVVRSATTRKGGVALADQIADADLVLTSYTLLRLDEDEFVAQPWSAVLLDEAQFVKNRQSQGYKAVRRLSGRLKVALTGTPLENNLMDLWALLSIVAPGLFSDPQAFTELYRRPIEAGDADALGRLQRRIRPLVLRRTKADVAPELPPKQEIVLEVELAAGHRRRYDRQLQRERQKVLKLVDDLDHNRVTVLRSLTMLRQLALSPVLVDAHADPESAKLDLLVEKVQQLAAEGHRALVFSQFTLFLQMARERLDAAGVSASWLDGRTRNRARVIEGFRQGDDPVFLISLKAGGFGLTLVEADYVFILDPWWNPAAENQAIDRTHRIGQTSHVIVYRLVAAGTIEQKVLELQRAKRDLFDQVVGGADADLAAPLTADDIRGLLEP